MPPVPQPASDNDWEKLLGIQANSKQTKYEEVPNAAAPSEATDSSPTSTSENKEGFGQFRDHATGKRFRPGWYDTAIGFGKQDYYQTKCENNIKKVLSSSAPVKLLVAAMKSAGCELKLSRNFLCEHCDGHAAGGFDPKNKMIVVCHNNCTSEGKVNSVIAHELIHAFDYCRSKFDFDNIEHIRASAITHCSFISAMLQGSASPWRYKNQHQVCVKVRATESVMNCKGVSLETALAAVEKVFPKCYRDLEPFGRIPRRNSRDFDKAYYERFYYGYTD